MKASLSGEVWFNVLGLEIILLNSASVSELDVFWRPGRKLSGRRVDLVEKLKSRRIFLEVEKHFMEGEEHRRWVRIKRPAKLLRKWWAEGFQGLFLASQ